MRAIVSGATGFVGSSLTELLVRRGERVAILRRPSSDTWRLAKVLSEVTQIECDFKDPSRYQARIEQFAPDTVFHLAWHGVANKHRNDLAQADENLYACTSLLRVAIASGCKAFVGLGSQAEYGPRNRIVDENEPAEPTTLYGVAKLCAFLLCRQIAAMSGIRFAWLRLFSSYGPGDNPEWMIPYLIESLLDRKRPSLTACEQRWDYIHVADVAEGLYAVGASPDATGVFNLGSGCAGSLRTIVELIRQMIDPALPLGFGEVPYRADQVMHLQANVGKLMSATGWHPRVSLEEGLKQTVEWHRARRKVAEESHGR